VKCLGHKKFQLHQSSFLRINIDKSSPIIDVGGGESKFVDYLINNGYKNISVLDISKNAINKVKDRLGKDSDNVNWIVSDINDFNPKNSILFFGMIELYFIF